MNKLKAVVVDGYMQTLLGLLHSVNAPEMAVGILDRLQTMYEVKTGEHLPAKHTFIKTYTKSTRQLVERARVLYSQPEHAASNAYPDLASRRVFDWCLGNFGKDDVDALRRVLTQPSSGRYISNKERREKWHNARQELIIDILTLCDIVVNHKAIK